MQYDKNNVIALLQQKQIDYRMETHAAVYTSEEGHNLCLPGTERVAKNLFLRDDKKQSYYLLSIEQNKRVNLKELRQKLDSRPLSFGSETELYRLLGLSKGSVTPFGVLNDTEHKVQVLLDAFFADGKIGVHPNDNTATVWLQTKDLFLLLQQYGVAISFMEFI